MARKRWLVLWCLSVLVVALPVYGQDTATQQTFPWYLPVVAIILLLIIIAALLWYLYRLQRQIFDALVKKGAEGEADIEQLTVLFQYPLGLPAGTVRSFMAMLIVIISLFLVVLQTFITDIEFPSALTAVLGTVLGFYFGSRTSARGQEQAHREEVRQFQTQLEEVKTERDVAMEAKDTAEKDVLTKAATVITDVKTGIAWTKRVADVLPGNIGEKFTKKIEKVEQGVKAVEKITDATEKAIEATKVLEAFKVSNPVKDIVEKASQSFGRVLGGAVPAIAVVGAVAGIGAKLGQSAYQKWKARILHLPFSPAVLPLEVVDANTCFVLFLRSPVFKTAFNDALTANNRPLIKSAADAFIREADLEQLWVTYGTRFESRAQFETGLEQFRMAVADLGLKQSIDADLLKGVGDYDKLMANLDGIDNDAEAQADLHQLITIIDGLKQKDEPVDTIFAQATKEVAA